MIREPDGRFRLWYATMLMGHGGHGPHEMAKAGVWGRETTSTTIPAVRPTDAMSSRCWAAMRNPSRWPPLDQTEAGPRRPSAAVRDHNIVLNGERAARQIGRAAHELRRVHDFARR